MADRCQNWNWTVSKNANGAYSYEAAQLAVLMDIRDELQRLNRHLNCPNFNEIPTILRRIRTNTAKPKKLVRKRK